jgi:hypothetical protein
MSTGRKPDVVAKSGRGLVVHIPKQYNRNNRLSSTTFERSRRKMEKIPEEAVVWARQHDIIKITNKWTKGGEIHARTL